MKKIFGMIDYLIGLNNLAKFGFGKIFRDGGTYAQHIRVRPFFHFFQLFTLFDEGAAKTAGPILTRNMSIDVVWQELDPFLEKKISVNDLDLKKVKIRHFMRPSKF